MVWGNWSNLKLKKRYSNELMQLFGDLDNLSFVRISRLNRIGHVNRMDSKRKVSQVFNNNPQVSRQRGRPKNRRWNCEHISPFFFSPNATTCSYELSWFPSWLWR